MRHVKTQQVRAVCDGWMLVVRQVPWPRWVGVHAAEALMAAVGHPCCGHGFGRITRLREAADRFLERVEVWSDLETLNLAGFIISEQQAELLDPGLVDALGDSCDPGCDGCTPGRQTPPWENDNYPDRQDIDLQVIARWLGQADDVDMTELVARAVAGDEYDLYCCVWCFDRAGWAAVGVDTMSEAVLWMSEGAGSPGEVQGAKDSGLLTSWALRVMNERTQRQHLEHGLDSL